jgi:hypothetical protein
MEVSGQLHTSAALSPWEEPLVPTGQEAWWAQKRSGSGGEEKNSQPPPGIELCLMRVQVTFAACRATVTYFPCAA